MLSVLIYLSVHEDLALMQMRVRTVTEGMIVGVFVGAV